MVAHAAAAWYDHPRIDVAHAPPARAAAPLAPEQYHALYEAEHIHLYQRRIRMMLFATMLWLPLFWLLYIWFVPSARAAITALHSTMFLSCFVLHRSIHRAQSMRMVQNCGAASFAIFALTAGGVLLVAPDMRLAAMSGHAQVILSLLFVPFSWRRTFMLALFIVVSYAIGLAGGIGIAQNPQYWWLVLSMLFTGGLIAFVAYLQGAARQHAFDSAFATAVTALHSAEASNRDAVTGGFNRHHLERVLEFELAHAARFMQPIAVLMFDLDHFKSINDTLGHLAGDVVLREVLHAASTALRDSDTVARYGGDEFVVIMPASGTAEGMAVAERLRDAVHGHVQQRFGAGSVQSGVTLSIGVAVFEPGQLPDPNDALALADRCLYHAKRNGRNRIHAA